MSKDPKDMNREERKHMEYKRVPEIPVGTVPPLGVLPDKMHAWVIREERFGEPLQSFQEEMMDIPEIGRTKPSSW